MDRRGFLKNILVCGIAPYVVTTAGVLMPVRGSKLLTYNRGLLGSAPLVLGVDFGNKDEVVIVGVSRRFKEDIAAAIGLPYRMLWGYSTYSGGITS